LLSVFGSTYTYENLFPIASNDEKIYAVTLDELLSALTHFKNKKAPGSDEINFKLLKQDPLSLLIRLLDLINMCWRTVYAPEEWNIGLITPVRKEVEMIVVITEVEAY
jgi:hypothetical protein